MISTRTLEYRDERLFILDQTLLPVEKKEIELKNLAAVEDAIRLLRVRGAPAIGVAAAFGVLVGMKEYQERSEAEFQERFLEVCEKIQATRPTAVNLFWAMDRMKRVFEKNKNQSNGKIFSALREEALSICEEDRLQCKAIGENGARILQDGDAVLTHCNAGALATAGMGTALAVIYTAVSQGKEIQVFSDETRPLLQGARLTTWELMDSNIPVTLICDSMAASVLRKKWINKIIVGADRIAANGDTANKIGTYSLAVLAHHHQVPFYVAAPLSTFDFSITSGEKIPIEERNPREITHPGGVQIAPEKVHVYNPAFDVTPVSLISGFITDRKNLFPPYPENLSTIF